MDVSIRLRRPDEALPGRVSEPQQAAHERADSQPKNTPAEDTHDDRS